MISIGTWLLKMIGIIIICASMKNIYLAADFFYTGLTNYVVLEFYLAIVKIIHVMIIQFKKKLE